MSEGGNTLQLCRSPLRQEHHPIAQHVPELPFVVMAEAVVAGKLRISELGVGLARLIGGELMHEEGGGTPLRRPGGDQGRSSNAYDAPIPLPRRFSGGCSAAFGGKRLRPVMWDPYTARCERKAWISSAPRWRGWRVP